MRISGDVNYSSVFFETPLMFAVHYKMLRVVDHLLENGASVDVYDSKGTTPLMLAIHHNLEVVAVELLRKGARSVPLFVVCSGTTLPLLPPIFEYDASPLLLAVDMGMRRLVPLLIEKDADVNSATTDESYALIVAVANKDMDMVELLLENGADVDKRDYDSWTPLTVAAAVGNEDALDRLLEANANVSATGPQGYNAAMIAIDARLERASLLLLSMMRDEDLNFAPFDNCTALWLAASNGMDTVVSALLERRAHTNTSSLKEGWTALMVACVKGYVTTVSLLAPRSDREFLDDDACDALMLACKNGHVGAVVCLLHAGVSFHTTNKWDLTARDLATINGHMEVLEVLNQSSGRKRPRSPPTPSFPYAPTPPPSPSSPAPPSPSL